MRPMDGVGNRRCCAVYLPLVILLLLDIPIYCSQQPDKAHQRRQRQFISKKQTTESTIVLSGNAKGIIIIGEFFDCIFGTSHLFIHAFSAEELHHSTTPGDSSDQFPIDEDHGKDRSTTQSQSVERLERLLRSENAIDQVDEKKFPNNEFVAENVGAAAAAADTKLDYFKENGKQRWGKFFQQDPNAGSL